MATKKALDKERSLSDKNMAAAKTRGLRKGESPSADRSICAPSATGFCFPMASQNPINPKKPPPAKKKSREGDDSIRRSLSSEKQSSFDKTGEEQQVPLIPREIPIM